MKGTKKEKEMNAIKLVKKAIGDTSLSLIELAKELGVSLKTITRWYQGKVIPSLSNYIALCELIKEKREGKSNDLPSLFFIVDTYVLY